VSPFAIQLTNGVLEIDIEDEDRESFEKLQKMGAIDNLDGVWRLKSLYRGLNWNGELILDTFMIDGEDEVSLTPKNRYSKIPNVYFIPTINALKNWCYRAGFNNIEILNISKTQLYEQRRTEWIDTESLDDFLDKENKNRTIEGYPAPKRVYVKAKKIKKMS
jgi:tRNA (mo5U34)-methyltransferase